MRNQCIGNQQQTGGLDSKCWVEHQGRSGKENWWQDDVQEPLKIKKEAFKRWSTQRDKQSRMAYKDAKMVLKARQERSQIVMIC